MVRMCAGHRVPVIAYGAGTSIEGHIMAVEGGVTVDLSRMNRVIAVNGEDLTASVEAGVTRKQLTKLKKQPTLFLEFHGTPSSVEEQAETAQEIARRHGGHDFEWAVDPRSGRVSGTPGTRPFWPASSRGRVRGRS